MSASHSESTTYSIVQRHPSPDKYYELRKAAGLTPPPREDVPKAIAGSWAAFLVIQGPPEGSEADLDSRTVGMGRLIGDGALFLDVVDVAIHPAHQRRGLGKKLMQAMTAYADKNAPQAYVSLVADMPGGPGLYSQFGFVPVEPSIGMYRCERVRLRKEAKEEAARKAREDGETTVE